MTTIDTYELDRLVREHARLTHEHDRQEKRAAQTLEGSGGGRTIATADEAKEAWEDILAARLGTYAESMRDEE